ncbi:hypothetical protein BGW36DRAFT_402663 [Talaromyces proteolyticus]|uniref:Uncharacterized protein n=1 Tax=Talaromyces proteolyticus TaxID=1131652 RepID=A0AAD4L5J8_9EURO|nr:uncharacterized protein BGW36DRAFT_402663 [Talaromyces proteolyticus]KAH8704990.1 hypothetical protein BGW36DRAFT_402663 [Talaromyces proteolyticus]
MPSVTTRLRSRLQALWKTVHRAEKNGMLGNHSAITEEFLRKNKIRLVPHTFDRPDNKPTYSSCDPPILFAPLSQSAIDDYPIDADELIDPDTAECDIDFIEYSPPKDVDNIYETRWRPNKCTEFLFSYLENWVFGGFPRKNIGKCAWALSDLSGITRVSIPHGLYLGKGISKTTGFPNKKWNAAVYEYRSEDDATQYPHVILLSRQSDMGHDGSMMHGELMQLITAMRNRAYQPMKGINEDDAAEEDIQDAQGPEFLFKDEQRFPVLMVSLVGPQHTRIYYACMDGQDVVIRQSPLYSLEKKDTTTLDYLASFLSSKRLEEVKKMELS